MCYLTTKSYLNIPFCELLQRREEWAVSIVSTFRLVEKSMQLTRLGEVLYFSVQMKFNSAISQGVDQVQPSVFSQLW